MARSSERGVRYRASPNLVTFWKGGAHRVLNFATKTEVAGEPIVLQLLSLLQEWRTIAEVARALGVADDTRLLTQLVHRLAEGSFVRRSDRRPDPRDAAMEAWAPWNPAVGHFHALTTGVAYLEDDLPPVARTRARPPAKPFVAAAGRRTRLAMPDTSDAFAQVLLKRRTWRRFSRRPIDRTAVERLLWLTAGVQQWLETPRGERLPLTTSPSGGARHPIDVFVLARHVTGLASGLYRYDGVAHALLSIGPPVRRNRDYLPRQYWYEGAALLLLFSASYQRTLDRYQCPRAYRAVLLEAGHVCQTFCLAATALGLAPFCTMALDDRRIDADLGLDGISSGVLYAAGVGVPPPAGVPSAPEGMRRVRIRRRAMHTASTRRPR